SRLRHEPDGALRTRVRFEHEEHVGGDGELDVDQAENPDARGDGRGRLADSADVLGAEGDGRQRAGGVAGVDTGLFDVLHHAAEIQLESVIQGVDIDLDRVVEEPVDQHGVTRRDLRSTGDVRLERL